MKGLHQQGFIDRINSIFVCLMATILHHQLDAYVLTGKHAARKNFTTETMSGMNDSERH